MPGAQGQGITMTDAGQRRRLAALKAAAWAVAAMVNAETQAIQRPGVKVTVRHFGVTVDVVYGHCSPFCDDRHILRWMGDVPRDRASTCSDRDTIIRALTEAALADAANVEAAMEAN